LNSTSRVVGQAKRFSAEITQCIKRATTVMKQLALEGLREELDEMVPPVKQVMKQARVRIFRGDTRSEGKPRQPVRAIDRNHPQGQDQQAY
jgi:transposase, IS5 family